MIRPSLTLPIAAITLALVGALSSGHSASAPAPAQMGTGAGRPEIPAVRRKDAICFAYYTVNDRVLKLTAQLYPLQDGESRAASLEIKQGTAWETVAHTRVTEDAYNNYRNDKTWTAHFRVGEWDESRTVPYRVVAIDGITAYEGVIRANPVGKREVVVAVFTGNSKRDRRMKPDMIDNLKAQDPDVLFFSGDQSYDHEDHLGAWLLFGRQFGEIIKDRPMISIPDDHDVGQSNLWGAEGKMSKTMAGDDGGYFMPVEYVKAVERTQTWHLPDPVDPAPIQRGIGVYFTALTWGGVSFAILEDRKFKPGPDGLVSIVPKLGPRPDHVTVPDYDPESLDVPGAQLLGERQEKFLAQWGGDWSGAEFKVVLSQTIFNNATHLSRGTRVYADLDSNGWPQTGRRRAVDLIRRAFAVHLSGDQHLGCVVQYGVDDWRDAGFAFCVPSIVNYYPREWAPLEPAERSIEGALPHLGDYVDGLANKLTMRAYANPDAAYAVARPADVELIADPAISASGYGLVRFDKSTRRITFECWPRGVDATQPGARQYAGWPITVAQEDNYGRTAVAWLPRLKCDTADPVVQVVEEASGEVVYTLRIKGREFSPKVFQPGTYTLRIGEGARRKEIKGLVAWPGKDASILEVQP